MNTYAEVIAELDEAHQAMMTMIAINQAHQATLDSIAALHRDEDGTCFECGSYWPCETFQTASRGPQIDQDEP